MKKYLNALNKKGSLNWARLCGKFNKQKRKIKLVAIAKNEAAYLPDWIFHHMYCGFDHISIYVNNTDDNTQDIIDALKTEKRVEFVDGNRFFQKYTRPPQISVYLHELYRSRWQGYSHVMFLDIDEFLMSQNLELNFRSLVKKIETKVCSFEWFHKMDEHQTFLAPIAQSVIGRRAPQVKSILSTSVEFERINPHNIFNADLDYALADGSKIIFTKENYSKLSVKEQQNPLKEWFVMHRMLRHEIEYIAALKRGRPIGESRKTSMFKDNRNGIFDSSKNEVLQFPASAFAEYNVERKAFLNKYHLKVLIDVGQKHVLSRYADVIEMIKTAPKEEANTLQKVLKNITNKDALEAYNIFLSRNQL